MTTPLTKQEYTLVIEALDVLRGRLEAKREPLLLEFGLHGFCHGKAVTGLTGGPCAHGYPVLVLTLLLLQLLTERCEILWVLHSRHRPGSPGPASGQLPERLAVSIHRLSNPLSDQQPASRWPPAPVSLP